MWVQYPQAPQGPLSLQLPRSSPHSLGDSIKMRRHPTGYQDAYSIRSRLCTVIGFQCYLLHSVSDLVYNFIYTNIIILLLLVPLGISLQGIKLCSPIQSTPSLNKMSYVNSITWKQRDEYISSIKTHCNDYSEVE